MPITFDGGGPLAVVEDGELAEGLAGAEPAQDLAVLDDVIVAVGRHVEVRAGLALADDVRARGNLKQ
jgi:hypothetical protein